MERMESKLLGTLLGEVLGDLGLKEGLRSVEMKEVWKKVVGERAARATGSLRFRDGVVYVSLSSSIIRNSLYYNADGIIRAMNAQLGEDAVRKLVLK